MKKLMVILAVVSCMALAGCGGISNWVTKVKANTMQGDFRVTVYSGGQAVKVWEVKNGYVSSESQSDGWFFSYNGKLVRVAGTVTVEQL